MIPIYSSDNDNDGNDVREISFEMLEKRKKLKFLYLLIIPVIALIIVIILFSTGFFNLKDYYTCSFNASGIIDMKSGSNSLAVLTQTKVYYIDNKGKETSGSTFSYSDPVLAVNGRNILVYDRGGTGYRVERNAKNVLYGTAEANIVTAAVGRKNIVAYSVNSEPDSFSQSSVFIRNIKSDSSKRVFTSASDYCVSLAVSDNDKSLAVALLGVENAEYYIDIVLVDIDSSAETGRMRFSGENLAGLDYISNDTICVYTDKGVYQLTLSGTTVNSTAINESELLSVSVCPDGFSAVTTAKDGNTYEPLINVYNRKGSLEYTVTSKSVIDSISSSPAFIGTVSGNSATVYDKDGNQTAVISSSEYFSNIAVSSDRAYLLVSDAVYVVPILHLKENAEITITGGESETEPETTDETTTLSASGTDAAAPTGTVTVTGETFSSVVETSVTEEDSTETP